MYNTNSMQTPDDAEAPLSFIYPIAAHLIAVIVEGLHVQLVDRYWRRSGTLLYRPNPRNSCCPHYTLRLDSTEFKPTKDQRQTVNRFNNYVIGPDYTHAAARVHPRTRQEARKRHNEFDLIDRIHEPEAQFLKTPPEPAHKFTVTLEPDDFTEEKYLIFENYQRLVHKEGPDKISRHGFKRFLCNSPLKRETIHTSDGVQRQVGSFHQCYWLDGKLVAIGVLDLLPHAVSSVYFLYHESFHSHNPGKLSAMREIALAREGGYRWWYPGFYIHSCPKMKYKMDFKPQSVLDPETLTWDLMDKEALAVFDAKHYVSLSRERQRKESGDHPQIFEDHFIRPESDGEGDEEEGDFMLGSSMPGIPSLEEMKQVDMDNLVLVSDAAPGYFLASDLVSWEQQDIELDRKDIKSMIAELVAAMGTDVMGEICVDFRRRTRVL
ncbi:arginine-tRNA-protein transferase [Neurospora intermedia]|uniref:arginyltransferase n=1 Tax=Neurospora intermedia TaxID=5142 RepID=A0ABR3DE83_NEUIN